MAENLTLPASPKAKALRLVATGLTKAAIWAVKHPETIIQIVRQIKAEEAAKSAHIVIKPR
jgi:hypothetical protein